MRSYFLKENPGQPGIINACLPWQNTIWLCHQGTPIVSLKNTLVKEKNCSFPILKLSPVLVWNNSAILFTK